MVARIVIDMFEEILLKLKPISDEPEMENIQFNFKEWAENITQFLTNSDMPWPFAIAIHGEWGSGKTTLLKNIKKKLEDKKTIPKIIEFSAWEYEKTGIFASLLQCIENEFDNRHKKLRETILLFGVDVILRNTISMSKKEAKSYFKEIVTKKKTLKTELEELVDKKLVIFIDDLDRCNVENTLSMLENIKFFLTIKNIVIIIAVDMNKVEQAWELRYNNINAKTIGRDHAEKMFQLKISIPHKSENDLKKYVNKMAESFKDEHIEFFIKSLPPNPRKIKLALNLIYFVLSSASNLSLNKGVNENDYLCTLITWISIINNHKNIAKIVKKSPSYLAYAAFICYKFKRPTDLKKALGKNMGASIFVNSNNDIIDPFYMNFHIFEILEIVTTNDNAFSILYHYALLFKFNNPPITEICISGDYDHKFEPFYSLLEQIIKTVPI